MSKREEFYWGELKEKNVRYSRRKPRAITHLARYLQRELNMDKDTARIIAITCVKGIRETLKKYGCISIERTLDVVLHYIPPRLRADWNKRFEKVWTLPRYVAVSRISRALNMELLETGIEEPRMYESAKTDRPGRRKPLQKGGGSDGREANRDG